MLNTGKIREIIAAERPDVLEIHSPYMAAVGALRARPGTYGVRTFQWHSDFIDTYGGVLADKAPFLPRPLITSITMPLWSLVRSIARRCDATLVASRWQVRKLEEHHVANVVHRPFGIERSIFRAGRRSAEGRRALLDLTPRSSSSEREPIVFVGLGRFAIEKRWDLVIDTFLRVREARRDVRLVLFGDGPERDRMRERARPAGDDVVLPGFSKNREELATHLANADMLLHGCPFETFGLSIAEAMSCGLPCVVPDDGGAGEMHDPESGETYRANDEDAFVRAVLRLLDRIERSGGGAPLREAAVRAASKLPTVQQQFEEQIALYAELLGRRSHENGVKR